MGKSGFDVSGLKKFQKELEKLKDKTEPFAEDCAKNLGARVLRRVVKRTPVGQYGNIVEFDANIPEKQVYFITKDGKHVSFKTQAKKKHVQFTAKTGKVGGTLRRGWTTAPIARTHKNGNIKVVIYNPVEYASYVEYGHRTRGGKGFVRGQFMLEKSRQEVDKIKDKVVEDKLNKFLGGAFK